MPVAARGEGVYDKVPDTALPLGASAPAYGVLKTRQASAAFFPLASQENTGTPSLGRIWTVQGTDLCQPEIRLEGAEGLVKEAGEAGLRMYIEAPEHVSGRSWQLAAALAIRVQDNSLDSFARISLASDWLITGEVNQGAVGSIQFGNKMDLVFYAGHRKWLYPTVDRHAFEFMSHEHNGKYKKHIPGQGVDTVLGALQFITGSGAHPRLPMTWPQEMDIMHALVGKTTSTVLVAALIAPPRELHLWHSVPTKQYAEKIRADLMAEVPRLQTQVFLHEMPTHDMAAAEKEIAPFLGELKKPLYFNITSSNRIMMLAVADLARQSAEIKLIYRDIDNQDLDYYHIYHESGNPHTCLMTPAHLSADQTQRYKSLLNTKPV